MPRRPKSDPIMLCGKRHSEVLAAAIELRAQRLRAEYYSSPPQPPSQALPGQPSNEEDDS